ncbi:MAG: hypothetical protein JSV19_01030 [Phycisphaerales bacterium]|nr:MAG: hypothetical protein JSV19_01030 [Phycisphaerales bacterium]
MTLAQVLINGNTTGNNPIVVNQLGGGIVGETDDFFGDGADVAVFGGPTTGAGNDSGSTTFSSGNRLVVGGTGDTGTSLFGTGWQFDPTSTGVTGDLTISSGLHAGTGTTGTVIIASGAHTGVTGGPQGDIHIAPGTFFPVPATTTGDLMMKGGSTNVVGVTGGDVYIASGENSSASGNTGNIEIETWDANQAGDSGYVVLVSGDGGSSTGDSGDIGLRTGVANVGDSGDVIFLTGSPATGQAGDIVLQVGNTTSGDGGDVIVTSGATTDAGADGGDIILTPGTGPGLDGRVVVNGKLTVTGMIDPTGLILSGVGSAPVTIVGNDGLLWVDGTGPDGRLMYQNSAGVWDITTGGGATTLDALTDVTITAPSPGEILTLNGGLQWVNLPGAGGSGLPTVLGIDSTTGGTAGGITVSGTLGDRIASDDDLVLDPAVAPGNAVVVDGLRWPEADGTAGQVITTNGLGQLSFQDGGAGTIPFVDAYGQMQWGYISPGGSSTDPIGHGIFEGLLVTGGTSKLVAVDGTRNLMVTPAVINNNAGVLTDDYNRTDLSVRPVVIYKFEIGVLTDVRIFIGLTDAGTLENQLLSDSPPRSYAGLVFNPNAPTFDTNFHVATDNGSGTPTRVDTGLAIDSDTHYFKIDASIPGEITFTIYDSDFDNPVVTGPVTTTLPAASTDLGVLCGVRTLAAINKNLSLYSVTGMNRADLLGTIGGGGGNQDLTSVLGFGNATGGIPIQGDDNAGGTGTDLSLLGGSSTGGGGSGGAINLLTGSPDGAGNGDGGDFSFLTLAGAGSGDGGSFSLVTGPGGGSGGSGGNFTMVAGPGDGAGSGGTFTFVCGPGGSGGGSPGNITMVTGPGTGGGAAGGAFALTCGTGDGAGAGGAILMTAGSGGATGDGGNIQLTVGTGFGGGSDGIVDITGDVDITGKLTVSGLIDPTGLLMSDSVAVPFTPVGNEGGVWVNSSGELIYTNTGGDLNLSTAIGGGMGFLDALLIAGYGFLGPGNNAGGPQSYGVYGSSVAPGVAAPASITFGADVGGPFINLAVGAAAASEAWISTVDRIARRDARFKAVFKFQVASPSHADERIFIGFSDGTAVVPPSIELSADDPAVLEYMGLRQDAAGINLEFVARGSGGAMVPVFALPTDAAVHYLQIDASAATGDVTFTVYDADGVTISGGGGAQYVAPSSLLLPSLTTALRPFAGIHTVTGSTPRTMDFYFSSIVTRADVVDSVVGLGGGGGIGTLAQVLAVGNVTGGTDIELTNASQIVGEDLGTGTGGNTEIVAGDETTGGPGATGGSATLTPGGVTGVAGGDAGQIWIGSTLAGGVGIAGNAGAGLVDGGDGAFVQFWLGAGGANTTGDGGNAGDMFTWGEVGGQADEGVSPCQGGDSSSFAWFGAGAGSGTHTAGSAIGGDGGVFYVELGNGGTGDGTSGGTGGDGGPFELFSGTGANAQSTMSGTAAAGNGGYMVSILGGGGDASGYAGATAGPGGYFTHIAGSGGQAATSFSGSAAGADGGYFEFISGVAGQGVGHDGGTGGIGGPTAFILGDGGYGNSTASGVASGGQGGEFIFYCGDGGDADGFAGATGALGGEFSFITGNGGYGEATNSGIGIGGQAGDWQAALGSGGKGTGFTGATGGRGGSFQYALGSGGDAEISGAGTATAGNGGDFFMVLGSGGKGWAGADLAGDGVGGDGGACAVVTGSGGDLDGGQVPGKAGDGGDVDFIAGGGGNALAFDNAGGHGGHLVGITGPGGQGEGTEDGGDGGLITFIAGDGGTATGTGDGGDGGPVTIVAGDAGPGAAPPADGIPGDVLIAAGAPATPGGGPGPSGGKITLGSTGNDDALDDDAPAMKFGVVPFVPGPPIPVAYTTPWPAGAVARSIQLTIEAANPGDFPGPGVAAMTAYLVSGTSSNTGFVIDIFPLPVNPVFVHWVAYK